MNMNLDCLRDVLLYIEDNQQLDEYSETIILYPDDIANNLSHNSADVFYCIKKLCEARYLNATAINVSNHTDYLIKDITFIGHEYLNNVRSDSVWKKVKKKLCDVGGSASLNIISALAEKIALSCLLNS